MKKSKTIKVFSLILALALGLSLFSVGCGEKDEVSGKDSTANANGEETSLSLDEVMDSMPSSLKGTTINYFIWYDPMETVEADVIKDFEAKTGCKVNIQIGSYVNYITELNAKVSTGDAPDVVRMLNNGISRVKSLQPLDTANFNFNDTAWDKATMKDYTYNGKSYATNLVNTAFYDGLVVLYNKDNLEQNGIDDPYELWKNGQWTWSTFEKLATQYKKLGEDYIGASFCPIDAYAMSKGTGYVTYNGTEYVNNMSDPTLTAAWKQTLNWVKSGVVSKNIWEMDKFMAGKCGFFFASISGARTKDTGYRKFKAKKQLAVAPMPSSDDGSKDYQPLIEYSAWGIPQGAKNPEAVPYFLRFMLDMKNYSGDLFISDAAEEIYKEMISNPNRQADAAGDTITDDSGINAGAISYEVLQSDPEQISTILQNYAGVVSDAVSKANEQISRLQ